MKFKPNTLAVAVAGAVGAMMLAPPALALNQARTAAAIGANRVVVLTGATAPTKIVWQAIRSVCDVSAANPFDVYRNVATGTTPVIDPGDSNFGNSFLYSCRLKALGTPWDGLDVAFNFGVDGGSFTSVTAMSAVAANWNPVVNDVNTCVDNGRETTNGDTVWDSCSTVARRSMGGFSDVEAAMFQDIIGSVTDPTPGGPNGQTVSDIQSTAANAGQTFGLAVSATLYRSMQQAQGLPAGCQDDASLGTPTGLDDRSPECQPSIATEAYTSLVQSSKSSLVRTQGWNAIFAVPVGFPTKAVVCRRPDTSGTQASSNAYFLNRPCGRGPLTFGERPLQGTINTANYQVIENSGSGNVRTCLTQAGVASIGVLSGENVPGANQYAFIKLDGVAINEDAKNKISAIQGRYDFAYELVLHRNAQTTVTPAAASLVLNEVIDALGNPTTGDLTGLFQVPSSGFTHAANPTRVSKGSRGGLSCRPWAF
jgi:hypothetical protein